MSVETGVIVRDAAPARRDVGTLGPAAARFARLTLQKSAQTKATYESSYRRFAAWLAAHEGVDDPPPEAFTADALAAYLTELEQVKAPSTVKKERAALNRLARYFHQLRLIDATEILMVEGTRAGPQPRRREALDATTWRRVKDAARARLHQGPRGRSSHATALRDLVIVLVLGEMGLRSEEARMLRTDSIAPKRADGLTPWLTVYGKRAKTRELPIPGEVADAMLGWLAERDRIMGADGVLFPRLGRQRADGSFPDSISEQAQRDGTAASGRLSSTALRDIVRPVMLAAGVPDRLAHPHVLRHTYGTLFMTRPNARIEQLQALMGHSDISTTSVYLHHSAEDLEAAVTGTSSAYDTLSADATRRRRRARQRSAS